MSSRHLGRLSLEFDRRVWKHHGSVFAARQQHGRVSGRGDVAALVRRAHFDVDLEASVIRIVLAQRAVEGAKTASPVKTLGGASGARRVAKKEAPRKLPRVASCETAFSYPLGTPPATYTPIALLDGRHEFAAFTTTKQSTSCRLTGETESGAGALLGGSLIATRGDFVAP